MSLDTARTAAEPAGEAPSAPLPPAAALELEVVATGAGLDALEAEWGALHRSSGAKVFQSHEWQRAWWRHYGERDRRRRLHVVVLRRDGRAVCIAPFQVEAAPVLGPIRLRRLSFLGTGMTDYLDVLVAPGLEAPCLERLAAHLAEGAAREHVLSLGDIPDASPTRTLLPRALEGHGYRGAAFVSDQCPQTALGATWAETLDAFAGTGKHRRERLKAFNTLREKFGATLEVCAREEDLARDVDEFIAMHQRRWTGAGQQGVYADPEAAAFQREVARLFHQRGWLYLSFLRVNGARVSALCSFQHAGLLTVYLTGFADAGEAWKYSPGVAHHWLCMEQQIARGTRVYDFLRGTEPYKYKCGAVDVPNWTLQLFPGGGRLGRALNAAALLRQALARRLAQERLALDHQRRTHGLFSRAVARHLWERARATVRDGLTKLRSPEKSIAAAERDGRP